MLLLKFLSADGDSQESARRTQEFKKEISRKAKVLAKQFGIEPSLLVYVLTETAELAFSYPLKEREDKILKSGFSNDDLVYSPSIEDAIKHLGKTKAVRIFKNEFGQILKAWAFYQNLSHPWGSARTTKNLLFLTEKEWASYLGNYNAFLRAEKAELEISGRPKHIPQVSFLIRILPITFLDDERVLALCRNNEANGKLQTEIKQTFSEAVNNPQFDKLYESIKSKLEESDDDLPDESVIRAYRKLLIQLYSQAFENLLKHRSLNSLEWLAFEVSTVILDALKETKTNIKELKEIEDSYFYKLPASNSKNPEHSEIPVSLYNFILAFALPLFEAKNKCYADVRAKLYQYVHFTEFDFPILKFDFWAELEKNPEKLLAILSEANDTFDFVQAFSSDFVSKVNHFIAIRAREPNVDFSQYDDKPSEYTAGILADLRKEADNREVPIEGTDYIFKKGFRELHWKDRHWVFRDWECDIVELLYEGYKNKKPVRGLDISNMANDLHFKDIKKRKSRKSKLRGKNPSKKKQTIQKGNKLSKRFMFRDVFKIQDELNGNFIVAVKVGDRVKSGFYTLNPKWIPKTKSTRSK